MEAAGVTARYEFLLQVDLMRRGGYPVAGDDLSVGEWQALGIIEDENTASREGRFRDLTDRPMPQSELVKRGFAAPAGK